MTLPFHGLQRAILSGLVCVLFLAALAAPAAAQRITMQEALDSAASGNEGSMVILQQYMAQFSGRPKVMEARSSELIKALATTKIAQDPVALQVAITAIAQAARTALFSTPIAGVKLAKNFKLSERSYGFDFGPPDSEAMKSFQHITARDKRLSGQNLRSMRRPSSGNLFSDGVVNVEKFTANIPNGKWRVVLLTDNLDIGSNLKNPLGKKIKVNGKAVNIAQTDPSNWLSSGILGGQRKKTKVTAGGPGKVASLDPSGGLPTGPLPVGSAERIISSVHGILPAKVRKLNIADSIYSNEVIKTEAGSAARLVFKDNTILSIGESSSLTLDKFVFDPSGRNSQVSLSLTKGTMRFVTGNLSKERYAIRTPTATMGIRGTILEITVGNDGTTTTSVVQGEATVSSAGSRLRVKSGFSTTVRKGRPPTPPKAIPPPSPQIRALKQALGPETAVKTAPEAAAEPSTVTPPAETTETPSTETQEATTEGETGGMIVVEAEVVDGKLVIDLDKLGGDSTYLTAIIVEPADEESNVVLRGEVEEYSKYDDKQLAATNAKIDEEIGTVLSEIATAAGPQEIAAALGIEQPTAETTTQTSPN